MARLPRSRPQLVAREQRLNKWMIESIDPGPAFVAIERRASPNLVARELHQLMLHTDDLTEPRPEQILFSRPVIPARQAASSCCTPKRCRATRGPRWAS